MPLNTKREPCPACGCPGEEYDGHVCEEYEARSAASRPEYDRMRLYREGQRFVPGRNGVVEVGNAHGKVAVYLDAEEAVLLAGLYGERDELYHEILAAVDAAYPLEVEASGKIVPL